MEPYTAMNSITFQIKSDLACLNSQAHGAAHGSTAAGGGAAAAALLLGVETPAALSARAAAAMMAAVEPEWRNRLQTVRLARS
jgi:hypothetical protein